MSTRRNLLLPEVERWPEDRPVVVLEDVHKAFGSQKVLEGVSLTVETGKTTVIAGQSGSGKSVLLRLMNGLELPDQGRVLLFGEDLARANERRRTELRKRCTMVFQNYALIDSMTVAENIGFPLLQNTSMKRAEVRRLVVELLEMLEMPGAIDELPASLSGGMKKRVALARAVVSNPEVVLFDEPTTGLDPVMIEFVDGLIQRTQRTFGLTSVIISHDMASNRRMADSIAVLALGRIVAQGPFERVRALPHPAVKALMANVPMERLGRAAAPASAERAREPQAEAAEPVVVVNGLTKAFGANKVLLGVDLTIPARKITVVIGGSGSGKSVLIKHIIGLLRADAGTVSVFGQELGRLDAAGLRAVQARIGMLFQGAALFDSLTVRENIAFPLVEGQGKRSRVVMPEVEHIAAQLHVDDILDRMPGAISNGQRKRVGLARALITHPDIIIYDEPTTGQDPVMMSMVDDMIVEAAEAFDITSIVISHDMLSTFRIADQVAMLFKGEMRIAAPPEVVRQSDDPEVQRFIFAGSGDRGG